MVFSPVIVALDFPDGDHALQFCDRISPSLCRVKVGKELFTAAGPQLVEKLVRRGFDVFLDLKFHDIPNTVAQACKVAVGLGVWMVNVHALGGRSMLSAAREAVPAGKTKLIAVTLLTSMGPDDLRGIGLYESPEGVVMRLAQLARDCGLDGVVCSAWEAERIRRMAGNHFCLVTPGIRPADTALDDQHRVATPRQAIKDGADYLVIGRPVTQAVDPLAVLEQITDALALA